MYSFKNGESTVNKYNKTKQTKKQHTKKSPQKTKGPEKKKKKNERVTYVAGWESCRFLWCHENIPNRISTCIQFKKNGPTLQNCGVKDSIPFTCNIGKHKRNTVTLSKERNLVIVMIEWPES